IDIGHAVAVEVRTVQVPQRLDVLDVVDDDAALGIPGCDTRVARWRQRLQVAVGVLDVRVRRALGGVAPYVLEQYVHAQIQVGATGRTARAALPGAGLRHRFA